MALGNQPDIEKEDTMKIPDDVQKILDQWEKEKPCWECPLKGDDEFCGTQCKHFPNKP